MARRLRREDVLAALAELFVTRGPPAHIRSDNGPAFIANAVQEWLAKVGVKTLYITPAIIESEDSDYRYRAVAKREAALATLVADIDYDNFKNAVGAVQGFDRASVYGDVWGVLYGLQSGHCEEPAEPRMI